MQDLPDSVERVTRSLRDDILRRRYRAGERKVLNFLMGQVMKRAGGKLSPKAVRTLLAERIGAS